MKILWTLLLAGLVGCASQRSDLAPLAVEETPVDLTRYQGSWYEIARLPMPYQQQCVADSQAHYTLNADNTLRVVNRCRDKDGNWQESEGLAKALEGNRLQVSFLPKMIRWLPVGWGDYWILKLDAEYQTVLIGEPQRRYLWLLARQPTISAQTQAALLEYAKTQGYELEGLLVGQ